MDHLEAVVTAAVERVGPAVVGLGRGFGRGSGVVIEPGRILTSAHNVGDGTPAVSFQDGRRADGRLAGLDEDLDLALIELDTGDVSPVEWEPERASPGIGVPVVALADPGGRGLRATVGSVASAGRSLRGPRGRRIEGMIEHTAPLPRGSSGGPLVDAEGHLLGLNSLRLEGGFILAVPANAVTRERVARLARGESPSAPRLGVAVAPPRVARRMRRAVGLPEREGLLVRGVEQGSPAERAGVEQGDLLVSAAGRELRGIDDLHAALDAAPERLTLGVVRGTDELELEVGR